MAEPLAGGTVALAGPAKADDSWDVTQTVKERIACDVSDVPETSRAREVLVIDGTGIGLDFGVADAAESSGVEGKVLSPVPRKGGEECGLVRHTEAQVRPVWILAITD